MSDTISTASLPATSWLGKTENWLDSKGRGAWIAAMVLGFIFFWPLGLALLAYMIWSNRMFKKSGPCRARASSFTSNAYSSSGNSAFDAYKLDTLRRLEDEQEAFQAFLERLRSAKDKAEFDQFMDDRAKRAAQSRAQTDAEIA
ncbi:hypothetical protein AQS8620_01748 [Aquimixticola soesokkakensis]|uniref:DUF2852 domain-containing protein n=1 Tax=Aquimixticola soesokkakensis TaxID=1519096 RepID=A0A1Y5SM74_9RHOB|nr:DUF2852 domain-containing protein [Aquimixticola soesokkakensis]SLN43967.1 hypothetical protein AQS8620_01748 [Aquimixticola soesokkakensis]